MPRKQKQRFKQLSYAELQQKLLKAEESYGEAFPELAELFRQCRLMQWKMHEVVNRLAAWEDKEANKYLAVQGTYAAYDEPAAVQATRELLQNL